MSGITAQVIFVLYLLFVLGIGVYAARFTKHTPADFYLADRKVGTVVLALTLLATVLSAFTIFGIGAQTTSLGLGTFSFLGIAAVLYTIVFASVGVALCRIGFGTDIVTPAEFVRRRFESPLLGVVYLVVTGVFLIAMLAGQLLGGSVALDSLVGIPFELALIAMATFMIVYIHIAGYRGVIWSDVVQSAVLFAVLGGVFGYILLARDATGIARRASEQTPGFFELIGPLGEWTPLAILTAALAFTFGVPGYPHTIQRYFSARDTATMRRSGFLFALIAIPVYLFAAGLGAWSIGVIAPPGNADYVIPLLIETITHPVVFGIAMAGGIAAIMSTADSVALTTSSMVSRDVYCQYIEPDASELREVRTTQAVLIVVILLAGGLAWLQPAGIFDLIAFAVVGFATTSPPIFLGAYWDRSTAAGAYASLIFGPGITILFFLEYIPAQFTFGMHYGFVGVIIAYLIFVLVSVFTAPPSQRTITEYSRSI